MTSLSYDQIQFLRGEIAPLIEFQNFICISNIDERKFVVEFSKDSLLLCFQEPFLRFHLTKMGKQNHISCFSQLINQTLSGINLKNFEILNQDRILQFTFQSGKDIFFLIGEFFQKKPNFYFLNAEKKILISLNPVKHDFYQLPEQTKTFKPNSKQEISEIFNSQSIEKFYREKEIALAFEKKKIEITAKTHTAIKRLEKIKKTFENNLKKCLEWEKKQHEATLLQANFLSLKKGMNQIRVVDWQLDNNEIIVSLNPALSPKDEIKKRFKEAKKLKVGIQHQEKQLLEIADQLELKTKELQKIELTRTLKELFTLFPETKPKDKNQEINLPYRQYKSKTGFHILVGKNSSSNDALTFKYAKGYDLWLHVKDYPGSHVVIKTSKGKIVDKETIDDAVQLAIFYSKAKNFSSAEICLTEKKYVSRFGKSKEGKVQISKQKIIHAKVDPERFKSLKTH